MQGNEIEEEVTEMKAWQDKIRSVVPYTPGEQPNRPNMIKLNTNENPYPPAPGVRDVLDHFDEDRLRLYPDPTAGTLVGALANYYHVGKDQVFTGVGSDDVLAIAFMTFFNSDKPIFFPDITYSFYHSGSFEFAGLSMDKNNMAGLSNPRRLHYIFLSGS